MTIFENEKNLKIFITFLKTLTNFSYNFQKFWTIFNTISQIFFKKILTTLNPMLSLKCPSLLITDLHNLPKYAAIFLRLLKKYHNSKLIQISSLTSNALKVNSNWQKIFSKSLIKSTINSLHKSTCPHANIKRFQLIYLFSLPGTPSVVTHKNYFFEKKYAFLSSACCLL